MVRGRGGVLGFFFYRDIYCPKGIGFYTTIYQFEKLPRRDWDRGFGRHKSSCYWFAVAMFVSFSVFCFVFGGGPLRLKGSRGLRTYAHGW